MKLEDLDITLMLEPVLNEIIQLSNLYLSGNNRTMKHRIALSSTCLYHNVIHDLFTQSRKAIYDKKKGLIYPTMNYLGNIKIVWLPNDNCWKVLITNGKRGKNKQVKETIFVEKVFSKPHLYIEKK